MRCFSTLYLLACDPMAVQKRDAQGQTVKPHALIWECRRCGKQVGATSLVPRWSLVARLRRQAGAIKKDNAA